MVAPGWPLGRPGVRPVFFRSDFGAGLPSPSDDGGLLEFSGALPDLRRQVRDLRPQLLQLPGQRLDLRVLRRQQLPQPRVRGSQPRINLAELTQLTGRRGRTGHPPHTGRVALRKQHDTQGGYQGISPGRRRPAEQAGNQLPGARAAWTMARRPPHDAQPPRRARWPTRR